MPKEKVTSKFLKEHQRTTHYSEFTTKSGMRALRTYLGNVEKGQPEVWKAPFAKGVDILDVIEDWKEVLVSIKDKWPTLWEFENDLADKVGPMSVRKPIDERLVDIKHYYDDISLSSAPIHDRAIKAVVSEFSPISGLRTRGQERVVENMKLSTNSGTPYWAGKRRFVVGDTVPTKAFYSTLKYPHVREIHPQWRGNAAAVVGWRGQEGGHNAEDVKQRVVWMFPFGVNICEAQVYQPLVESAQLARIIPAWVSMDEVDKKVTLLFDTKSDDDLVVCTDFAKFDQHFNLDMQLSAKSILAALFTGDHTMTNWLSDVFPIKYNIPIIIRNGHNADDLIYWNGFHGMASGSAGTNADETLAHRSLQYEAALLNGARLNTHSQCLGDDGILTYPGITVDQVVKAYETHGQVCNPGKQYAATQDCVYLRRWHHKKYRVDGICVGVYSTCRALGRLRYLERFMDPEIWSSRMVALRQLSILENCKWHPLREQFAQFCMKRDKYRLGIDIPGFLDNIVDEAKQATDLMPDFLGYTKTLQGMKPEGILEWWIVKYLKSLK